MIPFGMLMASFSGGARDPTNKHDGEGLVYWQILLAQGICVGIGMGCTFVPGLGIVSARFRKKRAFATGAALTGSSVGGIVYPVVWRALLPTIGFRWAIRVLALLVLVLMATATALVRVPKKPPVEKGTKKKSWVGKIAWRAWSELDYALVTLGLFATIVGIFVPYFFVEIMAVGKEVDLRGMQSYWLVSLLNVGGLFGRLGPNFLADRYVLCLRFCFFMLRPSV